MGGRAGIVAEDREGPRQTKTDARPKAFERPSLTSRITKHLINHRRKRTANTTGGRLAATRAARGGVQTVAKMATRPPREKNVKAKNPNHSNGVWGGRPHAALKLTGLGIKD